MRSCTGTNGELTDQTACLCCSLLVLFLLQLAQCHLQNNPLYLEAFQTKGKQEDALKFHYIVHCALDAIEEKGMTCHGQPEPSQLSGNLV